jgi:hypothetical protein
VAKIFLVSGMHPGEVVAQRHVKQVAALLREYGHDVQVRKVPLKLTYWGALQQLEKGQITLEEAKKQIIANRPFKIPPDATLFDFHNTRAQALGKSTEKPPEEFGTDEIQVHSKIGSRDDRIFSVEIPAVYERLPRAIEIKRRTQRAELLKSMRSWLERLPVDQRRNVMTRFRDSYFEYRTPVMRPEQEKYLSPVIAEKIAARIHEIAQARQR